MQLLCEANQMDQTKHLPNFPWLPNYGDSWHGVFIILIMWKGFNVKSFQVSILCVFVSIGYKFIYLQTLLKGAALVTMIS